MSPRRSRPRVDHRYTALALRANPGKELLVGDYTNCLTALSTAGHIRSGAHGIGLHYQPRGAYDARTTRSDDGTQVWARYVGEAVSRG